MRRVVQYIVLLALTLLFVSPLLLMLVTSFKSPGEASQTPPSWFPNPFTTQAYERIFGAADTPVLRWFLNSMLAATANALLVVLTASSAAYALARLDFRGKKVVFGLIVATLFVPPVILIVPNYEIVGRLYWLDTLLAIIVPTAAGGFGVFFLRQFFIQLPLELEESAFLDGANRWQIFTRIVLPLSQPVLAALAIFAFRSAWNDFLWPLIAVNKPEMFPLPVALALLRSAYSSESYGPIMAGAALSALPLLVVFVVANRRIVEGVRLSGLKG